MSGKFDRATRAESSAAANHRPDPSLWATFFLMASDLVTVFICFFVSFQIRRAAPLLPPLLHSVGPYLSAWPILLLWPLMLWRENLYPGFAYVGGEQLRRIVRATFFAGLLMMAGTFLTQTGIQYSRAIVLGTWLLTLVLLPLSRLASRRILARLGIGGTPAVLLGGGETGELILEGLAAQRPPYLRPVAAFDDDPGKQGRVLNGNVRIEGGIEEAGHWALENGIQTAIIAMPGASRKRLLELIDSFGTQFPRLLITPDLFGLSTVGMETRDVGGSLLLELKNNLLYEHNQKLKRAMDYIFLIGLGLPLLPLMVLISAAILLESGRPVFFAHERIGKYGTTFLAWKYRTMVHNADELLARLFEEKPELREEWDRKQKLEDDPRLTMVGRVLRRFSLDELPQLWNVLRGDMSLVGPRPIVEEEIPRYGDEYQRYIRVRPGLTGLWQVSGRSELPYRTRVGMDTYYVRNWSIWLDMIIVVRSFWAVLSGRGAY